MLPKNNTPEKLNSTVPLWVSFLCWQQSSGGPSTLSTALIQFSWVFQVDHQLPTHHSDPFTCCVSHSFGIHGVILSGISVQCSDSAIHTFDLEFCYPYRRFYYLCKTSYSEQLGKRETSSPGPLPSLGLCTNLYQSRFLSHS